jgi:hypothetical protein
VALRGYGAGRRTERERSDSGTAHENTHRNFSLLATGLQNNPSFPDSASAPKLSAERQLAMSVRIPQRQAGSLRTRERHAEDTISMTSTAVNMYVFIFAFASAFLLGQKRPMLALSTRALLAVLLGLALGYAVAVDQWFRSYLGVATLIANVLFIAFAAIDFINWQKKRQAERS